MVERDQFYPTLLEWLGSSLGREFGDDFYFDESTGKIEVTRWPFYTDPRSDPEIGKQQLSTIRWAWL